jgi:probable HAF family extracellular repeat protein
MDRTREGNFMTKFWLLGVLLVVVGAGLLSGAKPPPAPPPPPPPAYSLTLLTNEFGGTWSTLTELNDRDDAIGYAQDALGNTVSFVTMPETRAAGIDMVSLRQLMIDAGHYTPVPASPPGSPPSSDLPSGYSLSSIAGINDLRQIAASATLVVNNQIMGSKPILLQLEVNADVVSISSLKDLSDAFTDATPVNLNNGEVNNDGDIVGGVYVPDAQATGGATYHLVLYTLENGWTDLGSADPGVLTVGRGLSDRDGDNFVYIIGNGNWRLRYDVLFGARETVRLQGTYSTNPYVNTFGVNNNGLVAGLMATADSDERAFVYNGAMNNLGNLTTAKSWNDSWAHAVNEFGITVGGSFTGRSPGNTGLIYVPAKSKTFDMANCLNAVDKAAYQALATSGRSDSNDLSDINSAGVICGPGIGVALNYNIVGKRAYLLTPVTP